MGKPKLEIQHKTYYRDIYFLYEALNTVETIDGLKALIKDLLTRSELRMLKRRWHIAELLSQGLDVRTTARVAKTSTGTVMKIKQILEQGHGGLQQAIAEVHIKDSKKRYLKKTIHGSKFVKGWFK